MVSQKPYCPLKVAFKGKETTDTYCSSWCAWYVSSFGCALKVLAQAGFTLLVDRKK